MYSQQERYGEALQELRGALQMSPGNPRVAYNLAVTLERTGNRAEAINVYQQVVSLQPDHPQARARLIAIRGALASPVNASGSASERKPEEPLPSIFSGEPTAPPGLVHCPNCGEFSLPAMSCEFCSAPLTPPPPRPSQAPEQGVPATEPEETGYEGTHMEVGEAFFRRLGGFIIDTVPVYGLAWWIDEALGLESLADELNRVRADASFLEVVGRLLSLTIVNWGLPFTYAAVCYATLGRTLGKVCVGLYLIRREGTRVGWLRGALRETLGKWMSGLCFGFGYLMMLRDPDQQAWHDQLCDTFVIVPRR